MLWRITILLLLCTQLCAQPFNAAPLLGMGNTGLAHQSLFNVTNNPAGIATIDGPQVGLAYQHHFLSTEIQSQAAFAAIPFLGSNTIGFSANSYGLKNVSNLLTLRGVYAKRFGKSFATSISANYHRYYVRNYQSDHTVSLDLGLQYYASDDLTFGALARNLSSSMFQDYISEYIPEEYGVGFSYRLSEQLMVSSDVYYDLREQFNFRGGLAYHFDARLVIRGGAASHPAQYFGGVGLQIKKIQIDIASSFHPRLGTSPQLALSYGF